MRALSATELLEIWEWGCTRTSIECAMQLVRAANPEISAEELTGLSIGRLDRHLLMLREWMFGPLMSLLADCDGCAQRIEVSFDVADIREESTADPASAKFLTVGSCQVQFRLPTCRDILELPRRVDPDEGRGVLLQRCVISVTDDGHRLRIDQLSEEIVAAIVAEMAAADPQANLRLSIHCPQCDRNWKTTFDIVSYLWAEFGAWARRLLVEVQTLAARYHWSERDILTMSPWRRQFYLSSVSA